MSEPAKKSAARKFATDDEERHCRFKSKKASGAKKESPDYDNDDGGSSANDRRNDFIARMEAAEKSKQKVGTLLTLDTEVSEAHFDITMCVCVC